MTQLSINTTWYLSLYTIHRRQKCNVKWSLFYLVAQIYLWSIRRGEIKVLTSAPVSYFIWSSLFAPLDTWLAIRIYWPRSNYLNTFSNFWILNWPRSVNHGVGAGVGMKGEAQVAHVLLANHFLPPSRHSRLTSFMNLRITDRELPRRQKRHKCQKSTVYHLLYRTKWDTEFSSAPALSHLTPAARVGDICCCQGFQSVWLKICRSVEILVIILCREMFC